MQLVFGRDAILNIKHITNWEHIRQRKQTRINENNKRENQSRRAHQYSIGDKILIKARKHSKHELEYEGPYQITQVNDNGTVRFQKGIINDAVNIRRIKPFHEWLKHFNSQQIYNWINPSLIIGASAVARFAVI